MVTAFLDHLEKAKGNTASTRNARLAAIKSFARFVELGDVSAIAQCGAIAAIPFKRTDTRIVSHLSLDETMAILDAPDTRTRQGIRDRAMLHLCYSAGLRVSELVSVPLSAVTFDRGAAIHIVGKGRRERSLPLWKQAARDLRAWIAVRGDGKAPELFLNAHRTAMTRAGFEYILAKYVQAAKRKVPSLAKKRVSPHVLRHTCAVTILQATRDLRKVALWLGHANMKTTEVYVRADSTEKLETVLAITPPVLKLARFTAPDRLLAQLFTPGTPPYAEVDRSTESSTPTRAGQGSRRRRA